MRHSIEETKKRCAMQCNAMPCNAMPRSPFSGVLAMVANIVLFIQRPAGVTINKKSRPNANPTMPAADEDNGDDHQETTLWVTVVTVVGSILFVIVISIIAVAVYEYYRGPSLTPRDGYLSSAAGRDRPITSVEAEAQKQG